MYGLSNINAIIVRYEDDKFWHVRLYSADIDKKFKSCNEARDAAATLAIEHNTYVTFYKREIVSNLPQRGMINEELFA